MVDECIKVVIVINFVSSFIFGIENKGLSEIKVFVMIFVSIEDFFVLLILE